MFLKGGGEGNALLAKGLSRTEQALLHWTKQRWLALLSNFLQLCF